MSVYAGDRPEFLTQAMESMLNQNHRNFDIHIFQDGVLTKNLADILTGYQERMPWIYLHNHPENRGLAVCLNEMIQKIKGQYDYFARMDSDDQCLPERLEKQIRFLESHPGIDVLGGWIIDMDETGKELKRVRYPENHQQIQRFFRKRNPMAHATVMYRRSYFDKAGLYPPVRLEDGLYWMQGMIAGCRFHNLPDFLVSVRRTDDFLKRRSGLRVAWAELKIKWTINRRLRFGPDSYLYAVAVFLMQLLPISVKKILYARLR